MLRSVLALVVLLGLTSLAFAGEANLFNPYIHAKLPAAKLQGENAKIAQSLGGTASSLQGETKYRKQWREEVYPVVFGNPKAAQEILVFIDYAVPQSQNLWAQVVAASRQISPQGAKIVVFAKSAEPYATELMGGGIWVAYSHRQNALDYYSYTLQRWNSVKQGLAAQGVRRSFVSEYDATLGTELPILYSYLERMKNLVPTDQQFTIVKYAFDAGNINMYQAGLAAAEYGVQQFPAVVVNGKLLSTVSAQTIIGALR